MRGIAVDRLKQLIAADSRPVRTQAELMGMSRRMLYEWMKGYYQPSVMSLKKLALFYGVSTDYLLGMDMEEAS